MMPNYENNRKNKKSAYMHPNKVDKAGRTKIFSSTSSGRLDKVKELIKNGADVNHRDNAGWCPLHEAAIKGQCAIARYLIQSGALVNVRGCEGGTPLHDACVSGFPDCVQLLVDSGADVYALNSRKQKPIDLCDDAECIKILKAKMKRLDDLASKDKLGRTRLHRACSNGDHDEALLLLDQGADTNARDHCEWTPLHCAVEKGHLSLVQLLIKRGADMNGPGCKSGLSVLHIACQKEHETIVQYLVESGADVHAEDNQGLTPYQFSCSATIRQIITSRIDELRKQRATTEAIDEATFQSNTQQRRHTTVSNDTLSREERKIQAIMKSFEKAEKKRARKAAEEHPAASPRQRQRSTVSSLSSSSSREGSTERILSSSKKQQQIDTSSSNSNSNNNNNNNKPTTIRLDPFKKDTSGRTQLHKWAIRGNTEMIQELLEKGANPCERDNAGYTPLHEAALHGKTDIVKILLQHNADVNCKSADLDTSLHDATENGYPQIVELLLKYGAYTTEKNSKGMTPLDIAIQTNNHEIQEILKKHTELEKKRHKLDLSEAKAHARQHLPKKSIIQPPSIPNSPPEQWHDFVGPHLKKKEAQLLPLYTIQRLHDSQLYVVDVQLSLILGLNTNEFYQRYNNNNSTIHLPRYPIDDAHEKLRLWSPLSVMLCNSNERELEKSRFLSSTLYYLPLDKIMMLINRDYSHLSHNVITIALDVGYHHCQQQDQPVKLPPKFAMKMQKSRSLKFDNKI